jgi:hypothetical protein
MAKAYSELEKKLGGNSQNSSQEPSQNSSQEPSQNSSQEPTGDLESLVDTATQQFLEKGEISSETLEAFKKAGIPPSYVTELVEGRKAKADGYTKSLLDTVGGEDQWKQISQWASQNLSTEDREAFNAAIQSGDIGQARLALYGVQARYNASARDPRNDLNIQGNQSGQGGPAGYTSQEEYLSDLKNPKYQSDEAYRQSVQLRLKATPEAVLANL